MESHCKEGANVEPEGDVENPESSVEQIQESVEAASVFEADPNQGRYVILVLLVL